MPARYKIHSALLLVGLIYGANYSIAKVVMPAYVGPFGVILIRVVTGSLLYWLFARLAGSEPIRYKRDYLRLAGLAVFGVALNQLMFFKGLSMTSPISASVIMTSSPITVLVVSYFLLHEKITARKVVGILLGATGAILLIGIEGFDFGNNTFLGNLFILINATSYSLFLFGTIYVLPFGIGEFSQVNWGAMPAHAWYALAYVVIATTFIAYLLNVWSLQYVNPTLVGYYIYLQPLFATLVAVVFRGDALTVQEALYAVLIFAGVYLVSAGR